MNLVLIFAAVSIADQSLKFWVDAHVRLYEQIKMIPGLYLSRSYNYGVIGDQFGGLFTEHAFIYTRVIPVLFLVSLIALFWSRAQESNRLERLGFTLLIAGGASNVTEHLIQGYVIDALQIWLPSVEYVPINIADSTIFVGIGLIVYSVAIELRSLRPLRRKWDTSHKSESY